MYTKVTLHGLELYRAGSYAETVRSRSGEVGLRVTEPGLELMEGRLEAGERLTILPPNFDGLTGPESYTEVYYVLAGRLRTGAAKAEYLGPGDILVARELQEPVIFTVERDVTFLCVTTQPTFHEVSEILRELKGLADEVELKDKGSSDHCKRVRELALQMGRRLGLSDHRLLLLDYSAYLHDVGKVEVPADILLKPGALSAEEWAVIKQHPTHGKKMVEKTFMHEIGPIIEQHHERFDGGGYPYGLAGDEIRVESYIVAIADAYDAMTNDRPYHAAISKLQAVAEIVRGSNSRYPADVVQAFLDSLDNSGNIV